jgi:predicted secreted protein
VDDEATAVTLHPGERTTLRLPGRGTGGYRWTHRVEGDADAVAVSVSAAPRAEINGRPPGTSVDELAVIEARRRGRATVILEQRRSWETTPAPQDRRVLAITVS